MKNTLDDFRVYQISEIEKFADVFCSKAEQTAGELGKIQGQLPPSS
jgi:type I restriction enzyme R subunit